MPLIVSWSLFSSRLFGVFSVNSAQITRHRRISASASMPFNLSLRSTDAGRQCRPLGPQASKRQLPIGRVKPVVSTCDCYTNHQSIRAIRTGCLTSAPVLVPPVDKQEDQTPRVESTTRKEPLPARGRVGFQESTLRARKTLVPTFSPKPTCSATPTRRRGRENGGPSSARQAAPRPSSKEKQPKPRPLSTFPLTSPHLTSPS